jgi:hypothetical protein
MVRARSRPEDVWQAAPERATTEEPPLVIDELEPRLTPDGWGGSGNSNNNPPGGQVGWGC